MRHSLQRAGRQAAPKDFAILFRSARTQVQESEPILAQYARPLLDDVRSTGRCLRRRLLVRSLDHGKSGILCYRPKRCTRHNWSISDSDSTPRSITRRDGTTPTASQPTIHAPMPCPRLLGTTKIVRVSPSPRTSSKAPIVSHTYVVSGFRRLIPPANASKHLQLVTLKLAAPGMNPTTRSMDYSTTASRIRNAHHIPLRKR